MCNGNLPAFFGDLASCPTLLLTVTAAVPYFQVQATSAQLVLYMGNRAARASALPWEGWRTLRRGSVLGWTLKLVGFTGSRMVPAGTQPAKSGALISTTAQMDIALVVVALLLFVVGPVVVVNRDLLFNRSRVRKRQHPEPSLPFLIIPTSPGASDIQPTGTAGRRSGPAIREPAEEQLEQSFEEEIGEEEEFERPFRRSYERLEFEAPEEPLRVEPLADMRGGVPQADEMDEPAPDATVVFHRPVDEAVQILPGRLQVLSGEATGKDFRLVSRIGETPQIVVGRETGPPYRHITLEAPTVSRRHARMDFIDGHWTITNLSETNPVLVNNRALLNGGSARRLSNGDCIELGEVALRFLAS